jgi:hypothetical protein
MGQFELRLPQAATVQGSMVKSTGILRGLAGAIEIVHGFYAAIRFGVEPAQSSQNRLTPAPRQINAELRDRMARRSAQAGSAMVHRLTPAGEAIDPCI